MFVQKFSIGQGNSDLYASSLVPWNDPKKNSSDQKPSKFKIFKIGVGIRAGLRDRV